jgi:hypothetical protein
MTIIEKIVLVTRRTRLEDLLLRFGTRDQARFYLEHMGVSFADYEAEHAHYTRAVAEVRRGFPAALRLQAIERDLLPSYSFTERDLVVVVGQDGLVVNCAPYMHGQSLIAVNPDPARIDGVLLPFGVPDAARAVKAVLADTAEVRSIAMVHAELNDGQSIDAVNDLFVGISTHASARYELRWRGHAESQSSSGIIISTGAGSTGWYRSIVTGSVGIASALGGGEDLLPLRDAYRFDWESRELRFCVREPFISRSSGAELCWGTIREGERLTVISGMPSEGVIFGDGDFADSISFCSGAIATVSLSDRALHLVTAA